MTTYEIIYKIEGIFNKTDFEIVTEEDRFENGDSIKNIIDAINYFEEIARGWGSGENKDSIIEIKVEKVEI